MDKPLHFFNWSLKTALVDVADSFGKARVRIVFTILLIALLKSAIAVGFGIASEQWMQATRAAVALAFYIVLFKTLLYKPAYLKQISHIMLQIGVLIVWSSVFIYAHKINLLSLQFVFMIMLCSFYTLGSRWGIAYSSFGVLPMLLFLMSGNSTDLYFKNSPQELASPGFEILAVLNFVSIGMSVYLFYEAFTTNVKEKEKLNAQLQLSIAEANKLAASKSNFLSTMSHELRTPLNSVIGITELLIEDKPEERQKENLKILQYAAQDLLSLINNVLDINKTDSNKLTLETVPFQLRTFMQNICAALRVKAADKQLDFVLDIDERLHYVYVSSDPTRLSQIIYNLVSNAIKFTESGSVTVKLECTDKTEHNTTVKFSVADTGIGIHPDRHEAVFDLFSQAESDITRKYGGTGLGLAIVKQILSLFNSSIMLESSPGNGTTFSFAISFLLAKEVEPIETTIQPEDIDFSHLKILVAEDNEFNRMIVKKQLNKLKIEPVIVENGQLAYESYLMHEYDLIFMDLHMPVTDGYEATKKIREIADPAKADVFIIAFSASVAEEDKILSGGFNDFLYKPVNMKGLINKLELASQRKLSV